MSARSYRYVIDGAVQHQQAKREAIVGCGWKRNGAALLQGRLSDGFKFIFQTLGFFDVSGEGRRPKDHNIGRSDAVVRSETR